MKHTSVLRYARGGSPLWARSWLRAAGDHHRLRLPRVGLRDYAAASAGRAPASARRRRNTSTVKHIPGTTRTFTIAQIADLQRGPADWFPEDHPRHAPRSWRPRPAA